MHTEYLEYYAKFVKVLFKLQIVYFNLRIKKIGQVLQMQRVCIKV